ncbi:MAG TPA: LutB/LldF family L-lactate oxidation iron-sulfur protein [Vicinamibacterales bacterium]|jgi:L-lactate dehydrogenase complex protein LldF
MSTGFPKRVESALADAQLRTALDRATGQLGARRLLALATLDQPDVIRDQARAARLKAVANLGEFLERFEAKLIANGAHVHWAETAADANQIVADIASRTATRRIVKSKSMVSEETHLNAALAHDGVDVVETDLGEYIVQLRNDRPSHIIAPIVHLTREQVGRVMEQRLAVPFTDDAKQLAAIARARLRQEFLRADMGISGANFGVVDTGTICLVTNEGNGRMVTTLPRVHVVLMGIEKLVETMADLDMCLKVLARSATGQKITVYTTLVRAPRGRDDADGPEELHVVLLDNGRSRMRAGDTAEILACIRCGACLNACPVYRTIGGHAYGDTYPGPVGAIVTPGLRGLEEWRDLPHASSLCGACREVCPVRLDIPRMLLSLRAVDAPASVPRAVRSGLSMFAWLAVRPALYRRAMRVGRWMLRRRSRGGWIARLPGIAGRWTLSRSFRAPARASFQELWQQRERTKGKVA